MTTETTPADEEKLSPVQEAAWNLSIAISNHSDPYWLLLKFAEEIINAKN